MPSPIPSKQGEYYIVINGTAGYLGGSLNFETTINPGSFNVS
jgi:hypothetical protein